VAHHRQQRDDIDVGVAFPVELFEIFSSDLNTAAECQWVVQVVLSQVAEHGGTGFLSCRAVRGNGTCHTSVHFRPVNSSCFTMHDLTVFVQLDR
jgi:hypothetical protein